MDTLKKGWSATKTGVSRTTQKVLVKAGKAEETIDVELNAKWDQFEVDFKMIELVKKRLREYLNLLKQITVAQSDLANEIANILEKSPSQFTMTARTFAGKAGEADKARHEMESHLHDTAAEPLSSFLHEYKSLEQRHKILERRRVDKDRFYRHKLKLTEKDKHGELPKAEAQSQKADEDYEALNHELHNDFVLLHNDRHIFFEPFMAEIIRAQSVYFNELAKRMAELVPFMQYVDTSMLKNYPHVITPDASTAAGVEAALPRVNEPSPNELAAQAGLPQQGAQAAAAPVHPQQATHSQQGHPQQGHPQQGHAQQGHPQQAHVQPQAQAAPRAAPQPVPRAMPQPPKKRAQALYAFQAQDSTELSFNAGDVLNILTSEGEWWEAELNGARGLVPANYIKLI